MKKRVEKALEYKVLTSQRTVGVAIVLICTIISNHELFIKIKTFQKLYLSTALLGFVFCIVSGIILAVAIPTHLDPVVKNKDKFTTHNKDFKILTILQFGSLAVGILFTLFILLDSL